MGVPAQSPPDRPTLLTVPLRDTTRTRASPPLASVSADGRYVAFTSYARLVAADEDDAGDVYVLDRSTGVVTLESTTADRDPLIADCSHPRLSGDGRYVVFEVLLGGVHPSSSIILRDRVADSATHISRNVSGGLPLAWSSRPAISEDGRVVVFVSTATDLVPGTDANGPLRDVYLFQTATGTVSRVSVDARGLQAARGQSIEARVSGDGRFVAFTSSSELDVHRVAVGAVHDPTIFQVYVRDTQLGATRRISISRNREPTDGSSRAPVISRDGRYVAFVSHATNLVSADRNRSSDIFLVDTAGAETVLVSRSASGGSANGQSDSPDISADGRFVAFHSDASDLVCSKPCGLAGEDINLVADVFLVDRMTRVTRLLSAGKTGWMEESTAPAVDARGSVVAFTSRHPMDVRDIAHDFDLFVCLTEEPSSRLSGVGRLRR
jgi:Tol biopolymer transport system component